MVIFLSIVCVVFLGLWIFGYGLVSTMGCGFRGSSDTCETKWPWELVQSDLMPMVITPGFIFVGLVLLTIIVARRKK